MRGQLYIGAGILLCMGLLALAGPLAVPFDPRMITNDVLAQPDLNHLLGTTQIGEDIFSQLINGLLPTIAVGIGTASGCVVIAFFLGTCAAMCGSFSQRIILRAVDIMSCVPSMVAVMLVMSAIRPDTVGITIILIAFGWHNDVRCFQARVLNELAQDYVTMARLYGGSFTYIMFKHLLPASLPLVTARFLIIARTAVFKLAGLSFLGLTDPEMINLGSILQQSLPYLTLGGWLHWSIPPALCIFLILSGLTLVGDSLYR